MNSLAATAAGGARGGVAPLAERIDGAHFGRLYDTLARPMAGYAMSQVRDGAAASDLVQEAFVRVLASRFEPENDEHLKRYLYRTLTNLIRDRHRAGHREVPGVDAEACAPVHDRDPRALDLQRAFARLRPRERRVLWLAHVGGFDHREIAAVLGVGAASVRVMLFRARRKLARRVELGTDVEGGRS